MKFIVLASLLVLAASVQAQDPPFNSTEMGIIRGFFLNNINIQGKGGVVASPDKNVPGGGSYYYNWMRDGALTMRAVWFNRKDITNAEDLMKSYVNWVLVNQAESDPFGQDIRGEPKFNLPNGDVFTGAWCRPQNDGAALRATTLMLFANDIMATEKSFVTQYLWTNGDHNGGTIKYDLDYVVGIWNSNTCDLWEEIQSNDFFWNRMNHRKALLLGAKFAQAMGDDNRAQQYSQAAASISSALSSHWTGSFVQECPQRQKDAAVICAFNNGYMDDGVFGPTSTEVSATINVYNQLFFGMFPINQADNNRGVPGILYGRYEGDHYGGGSPWILSTGNLAELYYRGATELFSTNTLPHPDSVANFRQILNLGSNTNLTAYSLGKALLSQGDGVLLRIRFHVEGDGFHMSEQFDKNTGYESSAYDLTWSYASVIEAMRTRGEAMRAKTAAELMHRA